MKKKYSNRYWVVLLALSCLTPLLAQDIYVGDGASFYLKSTLNFAAGSSPVNHHANGVFEEQAGVSWADAATYVDGKITVYDAGITIVNVGDTAQSLINITTVATDVIVCDYTRTGPTGTLDAALVNYKLSDNEYWTVSKTSGSSTDVNVGITAMTGATYNGSAPSVTPVVVRYNTTSAQWELYTSSLGFGNFSFASDQSLLGVNDVVISESFKLYPNPVSLTQTCINYVLPSNVNQLVITVYDVTGKQVQQQTNVAIVTGINKVETAKLAKGMYFMQFSFNNNDQVITKKLLVE